MMVQSVDSTIIRQLLIDLHHRCTIYHTPHQTPTGSVGFTEYKDEDIVHAFREKG